MNKFCCICLKHDSCMIGIYVGDTNVPQSKYPNNVTKVSSVTQWGPIVWQVSNHYCMISQGAR